MTGLFHQVHDGAHLDAAEARQRDFRSHLDRIIVIPGFDQDETKQLLSAYDTLTRGGAAFPQWSFG